MPTAPQLSNRPTSGKYCTVVLNLLTRWQVSRPILQRHLYSLGMEKLQQDFLDLDVGSLCEIFRLKSEQEEVSDFSFSFGQTDICEGLVSWVSHDLENRQVAEIYPGFSSIIVRCLFQSVYTLTVGSYLSTFLHGGFEIFL